VVVVMEVDRKKYKDKPAGGNHVHMFFLIRIRRPRHLSCGYKK